MASLFFIFGLVMGSFFNVVGLRVPNKQSIVLPGSHCTSCQTPLKPFDLIPVVSYVATLGKCRYCKQKVSILYPVIELATAILFAFAYTRFGFSPELIGSIVLISLLMIVFVSDISYMLIPDKVLMFFAPIMIAYRIWQPTDPWYDAWIGAGLGFGTLLVIAIISKGGMGGGDIKLFAVLGLMVGWMGILLLLFLASLIGSIVGLVLLSLKMVKRKQHIPFGPFIVVSAIIVWFWGDLILRWYFGN